MLTHPQHLCSQTYFLLPLNTFSLGHSESSSRHFPITSRHLIFICKFTANIYCLVQWTAQGNEKWKKAAPITSRICCCCSYCLTAFINIMTPFFTNILASSWWLKVRKFFLMIFIFQETKQNPKSHAILRLSASKNTMIPIFQEYLKQEANYASSQSLIFPE